MTARGISLHVGVNRPDTRQPHYRAVTQLKGCVNDARAMREIADAQGFESALMLDDRATAGAVAERIADAAERLTGEGIFLLTYSGHGSRVEDRDHDEGDGYDETWCLFDRELVDDDLFQLWSRFPAGARVLVISDSCHSATVIRDGETVRPVGRRGHGPVLRGGQRRVPEYVPARPPGAWRRLPDGTEIEIGASVLLLSAALDSQTAADGSRHGAFTAALLEAWDQGRFTGSYHDLQAAVYPRLCHRQEPTYEWAGVVSPAFLAQRPFTIAPP